MTASLLSKASSRGRIGATSRSTRMNEDGFQMDLTLLRPMEKRYNVKTMDKDSKDKKSIIPIRNQDELCCTRWRDGRPFKVPSMSCSDPSMKIGRRR